MLVTVYCHSWKYSGGKSPPIISSLFSRDGGDEGAVKHPLPRRCMSQYVCVSKLMLKNLNLKITACFTNNTALFLVHKICSSTNFVMLLNLAGVNILAFNLIFIREKFPQM